MKTAHSLQEDPLQGGSQTEENGALPRRFLMPALSHGKALRRRPVMQTYLTAQLLITAAWLVAQA